MKYSAAFDSVVSLAESRLAHLLKESAK
jgi:hypothetical protein